MSATKDKRKVASVAVIHGGRLLWLLRDDSKKLCLPGGKFEEGEEPLDAAVRELKEETGIDAEPKELEFLGSENVPGTKLHVYSFKYEPEKAPEIDLSKDPDKEACGYHWFEELPSEEEQFVPQERNVTLRLLGMAVQDLNKMAIKDIRPGPKIGSDRIFDYSHIHPGLTIHEIPFSDKWHHPHVLVANIQHDPENYSEQSNVEGTLLANGIHGIPDLNFTYSEVHPEHRGQGIGRKMYEALMAHALHNYGTTRVVGGLHSTLAHEAHKKLSQKHGFEGYDPKPNWDPEFEEEPFRGPFNDAYGKYSYTIKSESLAKSQPEWRSKDGLKIPKSGTPARKDWDKEYHKRLVDVFAGGDKERLKLVKIPVTPALSGTNFAGNKDRLNLYSRMIRGGDKLPPAVVKRNGIGWHVVDGNHRAQAALNAQVPEMLAYELIDPPKMKKAEEPFKGLAEHIVGSLTDDLRKPKYKGHENPLAGHCYVASEALWHMLGGPDSGWVPQTIRHENDTHWYLKHKDTGKILDLTAGQFKTPVLYDKGRGCGFLTKEPSKLAKELINRINVRRAQKNDPTLKKGVPGAMLAAGLLASPIHTDVMKQPEPKVQQQQVAAWTPDGLDSDLIPIAHLESSFGKNINHAPNPKGEYYTAYGAVGMKPVTAHEEYNKNQTLQKLYPNLKDPAEFMKAMKTIPRFYNLLASTHFARMKHLHGSAAKAAYAWRHGHTAAMGASPEQIDSDLYVQKYRHLASQAGLQKGEDLMKAISDLKPGKPMDFGVDSQYYDYSHLLGSPVLKKKYKIILAQAPNSYRNGHHLEAKIFHRPPGMSKEQAADWTNWQNIGHLRSNTAGRLLYPSVAKLDPAHQGRGLGKALYLATFKHGQHFLKTHTIAGEVHSSMAHRVHESIAKEHGLAYNAHKYGPEIGPNDGAYGEYEYALK